ncbi:EEIG1/EHBP1 protein amine-terminal domain protein (macronuclear) [Tetrahymena thermophila SB210]|uniref:EEIG1/EHBP1 protein amine-terminal domain protein n=1 Tax=Tetrahymena thermophila (strain SB210) TaxID=312017 RepID=Q240S3_TETTS|nr:EEIG1/EHBP1 protein amine-terminal domain protein [Tetrahymena thermophila SB210]EAS02341.2 EEIG1/EHBP1 protein amine-terminal domain protein [Tetrahymena thermophila SB210]|eukprot:XP_001022586.2 EEIG1/EHBP1 protein amine-terminal domain protein [Tetrahymena thermophila SB210]
MSIDYNNQRTLGYLYKFSILIEKAVINIGVPCKLCLLIKRGQQKIKLQNTPIIDPAQKYCYFDEMIDLKTNVYRDYANNTFWDKKISFTLVIESQNGNKLAGIATYNLATFLNTNSQTTYEVLKLNKCPDQSAKLYIKFGQCLIKELGEIDQQSSQNSLISDHIDDFHDITFQSSSNRSILSDQSQQNLDQNHTSQPSVKFETSFGSQNQINMQNQQPLTTSKGISKSFSKERIPMYVDKQQQLLQEKCDQNNENLSVSNQKITLPQNSKQNLDQNKLSILNDGQKVFILEQHIKTMMQEKDQQKQEILLLKQSLQLINQNYQIKTQECNEYQQRYEDIKNQRDDIKTKLDEVKKETEKIENQVFGKIELMREDFCKQLQEKQSELETLSNQNKNLNTKVKELINDNKTCSERILKNESTIKQLQEQLDSVNYQSTQINHSNTANINQLNMEIEKLQTLLKQSQENIQRLEYNKKRKEEEISNLLAEIHDLNDVNQKFKYQASTQKEEIQQLKNKIEELNNNQIDQDQFVSFLDKPSQIIQQNNQSMNMKSFISNTQNEFHSCIVQDFEEYLEKSEFYQNVNQKSQQQDIKSKSILSEVKEENSFEKQMKKHQTEKEQDTNCILKIIQKEQLSQNDLESKNILQTQHVKSNRSLDLRNQIAGKQQSLDKENLGETVKWEKIDQDNAYLKQQMQALHQKFEKIENQITESKKGLHDALALALKAGDQELIIKLQNAIKL